MANDDVLEFLNESRGAKYEGAKFPARGDKVGGVIEGQRVVTTQEGERVLMIDLENPAYSGGGITLWVRGGPMAQAIALAAPKGTEEGGRLEVTYTDDKDTGKKSPLKLYEARYQPPTAKVDVGSIFDDD